jgi:hypothetical protein
LLVLVNVCEMIFFTSALTSCYGYTAAQEAHALAVLDAVLSHAQSCGRDVVARVLATETARGHSRLTDATFLWRFKYSRLDKCLNTMRTVYAVACTRGLPAADEARRLAPVLVPRLDVAFDRSWLVDFARPCSLPRGARSSASSRCSRTPAALSSRTSGTVLRARLEAFGRVVFYLSLLSLGVVGSTFNRPKSTTLSIPCCTGATPTFDASTAGAASCGKPGWVVGREHFLCVPDAQ